MCQLSQYTLFEVITFREIKSTAIAKLFATLVFTGASEHVVQMGFYHLKNNLVGHRSDKTTLSVSTACPPRPALSSTERQRSAFVFDPGRGPGSSFNEHFAGSEARINAQQRLTELQGPPRDLAEHVDALASKSTSGTIGGIHIRAEKQQFELERRILALYKAGFSFDIIRKVLVRRPTPYEVEKSVLDALQLFA
ncbi:hypothetical protein B0H13DRAFT_1918513 [Mycena leptocephala]|nr:hypothetical protein B0H13DRAFT_1918513 [Mycena leptocephala]